jgi:hypothetical protein
VFGTCTAETAESESLSQLERLCDALLHIVKDTAQGIMCCSFSVSEDSALQEAVWYDSWNEKYSV